MRIGQISDVLIRIHPLVTLKIGPPPLAAKLTVTDFRFFGDALAAYKHPSPIGPDVLRASLGALRDGAI